MTTLLKYSGANPDQDDSPTCSSPCQGLFRLLGAFLIAGTLVSCQSGDNGGEDADARTVVDVTAVNYAYQNVPDSIPSGWTTFRMHNEGQETHHIEFIQLPEGITLKDHHKAIGISRELRPKLRAGEIDTAEYEERLPSWTDSANAVGGLGHLAPGRTASITIRLQPATYAMFCFVKTPEERNHYELGMERAFTVTADSTGADPPDADLDLRLSDYEITSEGEITAGEQTIAVHFGERPNAGEAPFQGIQLARVPDGVRVDSVAAWVNVYQTPAPVDFLGGAIAMDAGKTAYLTVDMQPGRYAWLSHASKEKGMRKTFTIE